MQPRSEPLLWLQCLALGAIPLELLLIRLVLAGADPGPVPGVERVLIWGVGVLAPAVALWRRPADWGSLLLVRQPLANRSSEQLRISASHGGLSSRVGVAVAAVILLPILWWLDDSAVLASEFSPVSGQSRLVTLLLVSPLSALIVWQLQQLVQAAQVLLGSRPTVGGTDGSFRADAVAAQRTSLGLQTLNLPALDWPEPERSNANVVEEPAEARPSGEPESSVATDETDQPKDESPEKLMGAEAKGTEQDNSDEQNITQQDSDNRSSEQDTAEEEQSAISVTTTENCDDEGPKDNGGDDDGRDDDGGDDNVDEANAELDDTPSTPPESSVAAVTSLPVEPEQTGKEEEGTALDPEISKVDTVAGGNTEGHREQAEASGSEESEPEQSSEPPPGSL